MIQGSAQVVGLALLISAFGCGESPDSMRSETATGESDAGASSEAAANEQQSGVRDHGSPRERAIAAKDALFEQLSGELMQAMSTRGPAAAISVCREKAPAIATTVGNEHSVKIGRTSFRLRNDRNVPPGWAETFVKQRVETPQFVDVDESTVGAFLPIRLKPQCLTCHGPREEIDPEVLAALDEKYPNDQATGFNIDDLRGWFWVEVPK